MTRCALCPANHRQVYGFGSECATVMIIAEGPGKTEDQTGIPFSGLSGRELDETYLPLAGLARQDVYTTNCVQCRCERNGQDVPPSPALIDSCTQHHLADEIHQVWPEVLLLLGASACSLVPGIDLELEHGIPRKDSLYGWEGWVVPMYHPAAGMRDGRFMIYSLDDWQRLDRWLRGARNFPVDPGGYCEYRLIPDTESFWILMTDQPEQYEYLPLDTESDEGRIWSIQFSTAPRQSYMIRTEDRELVDAFATWLAWSYDSRVIMHNAPHDLDELAQLGIVVTQFRDTMQELYHLGNLPQGLKAAVFRTLGHHMVSYKETVTPYSKSRLDQWLCEGMVWATEHREIVPHPVGADCPTCGKKHRKDVSQHKPHPGEAVLRRVMDRLNSDYDPWQKPKLAHGVEKPRLLGRPWLAEMEQAVGRMPRQSIVNVPLDKAVAYGCSDADWTGRIGTWLENERKRIVQEEWSVA